MFGKKKIVYQGFDMQEFNKIRELLRGAGIWHDWKEDDRQKERSGAVLAAQG